MDRNVGIEKIHTSKMHTLGPVSTHPACSEWFGGRWRAGVSGAGRGGGGGNGCGGGISSEEVTVSCKKNKKKNMLQLSIHFPYTKSAIIKKKSNVEPSFNPCCPINGTTFYHN